MSAILDDPLMHPLGVLCCGHDSDVRDEGIAFHVPVPEAPDQWLLVTWDEFDALIEKKWVAYVGEDEFEVTQDGRWWYTRWCAREEKRHRAKGPKRVFRRLTGRKRQLLRRK